MSVSIKSGSSGFTADVNERHEVRTFSVTETLEENAAKLGDAFNINTGDISSISSGSATLLYFYNDEDTEIIVEAFAVGLRGFTSLTDMAVVTLLGDITGGDLVSDGTAVSMKATRRIGDPSGLKSTTLAYKGKNSGTVTGTDIAQFYQANNSRLFAPINLVVPRGQSIAIKVVGGGASAGTAYAALVTHRADAKREDD
jgi:hypothetical protein